MRGEEEDEGIIEKVAIYTRVSTREQSEEGFSLDAQVDKIRKYCEARDWTIFKEYIDPGYTGRNTKRPMYLEMIADVDSWDAIVCKKGDRIHRNVKNFVSMQEFLNKHNKGYVSITESYDTSTAIGRLIMGIIAGIAQYESEQIGERVYDGMKAKAKDLTEGMGLSLAPFGYKMIDDQLIEIPEKLEIVKQIFELAKQGLSPRKIGKKLDIHFSSVFYRLHHPLYCGVERWCHYYKPSLFFNGNGSGLKPLLSIKEWNKIQKRLVSKRCDRKDKKPLQIPEDLKEAYEIPKKDLKNYARIVKNKQYSKS